MFSTGQKIKLTIILIMMVVGGVLETLGVSLIVPLMTTILDGEFMNTNRVAAAFCHLFGITNRVSFMLLLLGALILVFVLKAFCFWNIMCRPDLCATVVCAPSRS